MTADGGTVLVVHGGAGNLRPDVDPAAVDAGLTRALDAGLAAASGGALAAVVAAVRVLEEERVFNAGTGACLTSAGTVELDAAVMRGDTLATGAVATVENLPNPVEAALAVLEDGRHVLLAGPGASAFARSRGVATCDPAELVRHARGAAVHNADTVGAVCRDATGLVAVAVSTGGIDGKLPGRVGDSPLCGCGFYADSERGGACATGQGEAFIRRVVCKRIVDLMGDGSSAQQAAATAVGELGGRGGGTGGVIVVSAAGEVGIAHSTPHMSWAWRRGDGTSAIWSASRKS